MLLEYIKLQHRAYKGFGKELPATIRWDMNDANTKYRFYCLNLHCSFIDVPPIFHPFDSSNNDLFVVYFNCDTKTIPFNHTSVMSALMMTFSVSFCRKISSSNNLFSMLLTRYGYCFVAHF